MDNRKLLNTRVLIADDHPIFRDGLRRLLEAEAGFRVVGEACDGLEAVTLVRQLKPEILLLDLAMPRRAGLDALREISADTVKHHLSNIFDKLGVSTRLELALFAVNQSLPFTPIA